MTNQTPFSLTFGEQPRSYVLREEPIKAVLDDFSLDFPLSRTYVFTGVRGSGKTVILMETARRLEESDDWLLIKLNPTRDMLARLASSLYDKCRRSALFLDVSFSFSFHGFGISIEGKEPVEDLFNLVCELLKVVRKKGKKVLLVIDDVSNSVHARAFLHDFQTLLTEGYPVYLLMSGLYEAVNSLQKSENISFLLRASQIVVPPLPLDLVEKEYAKCFPGVDQKDIRALAELTKGYAFAYQVIGFLFSKYGSIDLIYEELDKYLATRVYGQILSDLPNGEREFVYSMSSGSVPVSEFLETYSKPSNYYSVYRRRLIERGLLRDDTRGVLEFALPRFWEFLSTAGDMNVG